MSTKREYKAAVRADRSGSGPTLEDRPAARFPGAGAKFALFGEVLMVGLLVALVGVLVVTLPAALAAGIRHLRRYVGADDSALAHFWADVRAALPGGSVVGLVAAVATVVLLLDIDLARSGFLPGGIVVEIVGWVGLAAVAVALLTAAGAWSPELGWRGAVRAVPRRVGSDIPGAVYLVATAGFVVVVTWALLPLLIPALGMAALAAVAIPERRRRA
ncbi:MAG: hypothetical protein ABW024_00830 [Microbacterium sp.]